VITRFEVPFADRLFARVRQLESRLVVGIDPVLDRLPASISSAEPESALVAFGRGILEAVEGVAAAVKPQAAYFERYGWRGWRALEAICADACARGIPVILDAKRGDIGSTAAAYAAGLLGDDPDTVGPSVDALTVNPYLGSDALEPFLARVGQGRGLFVLARTSNPGGAELQGHGPAGCPLYLEVARAVADWNRGSLGETGFGSVGLVAGATYPEELGRIRAVAPQAPLLIPGIGAQGGDPREIAAAFDGEGLGAVVNSSRGIIFAFDQRSDLPWQDAVRDAALATRDRIGAALKPVS